MLYLNRDIAGIAVIAGLDDILAFHKASGRKRDGEVANRSRIAVFVDVFTDKVFCDLRRSGGGEEIRRVVREAGSEVRDLNDAHVLGLSIHMPIGHNCSIHVD